MFGLPSMFRVIPHLVFSIVLLWLLVLLGGNALAEDASFDKPILRLEPSLHTAMINRMDVDQAERFVVTASDDKTARVWDVNTGALLQTLRPPMAAGDEGKLYAVAISPDGEHIAVAGWTVGSSDSVFIFKRRTGKMLAAISGLPNVINDLAYSTNGKVLAASLWGGNGVRFYRVTEDGNYQAIVKDTEYRDASYGIAFDQQGRSVSTSYDGLIRLYDAAFNKIKQVKTVGGKQPYGIAFSPDGQQIAVGFNDSTYVDLYDAADLKLIKTIKTKQIDNGDISDVAWSKNGKWLYAGGLYYDGKGNPVLAYRSPDFEHPQTYQAAQNTVMAIHPLSDGGLLFASADPALGSLNANGQLMWRQDAGKLAFNFYTARRELGLANDAKNIAFKYKHTDQSARQSSWDLSSASFNPIAKTNDQSYYQIPRLQSPKLAIKNWDNKFNPSLNGKPIALKNHEYSYSLAINPNDDHAVFALGTSWYVRLYNQQGQLLWKQPVSVAWAVNISADQRYVVAALGDGTIRWYELNTGKERLAFYLHPDIYQGKERWIAWTPDGFYATSGEDAEALVGFHINQGLDKASRFVDASQLREVFAREDLVAKALDDEYAKLAKKAFADAGDIQQILATGSAPAIILDNQPSRTLRQREFTLSGYLQDQGGGIGKIEYRVDGKLMAPSHKRGYGSQAIGGKLPFKNNFTLAHGKHTISVTAYNEKGVIASKPMTVEVDIDDPVNREPSLYVLSVGVSKYRDRDLLLNYAADDAVDFAASLKKRGRHLYKDVIVRELLDNNATLNNINAAFETIAQQAQPQDVFVFYLAGHGEVSDGRYHFIPHELIYSNEAELRKQALNENKLKALISSVETAKRLVVMDSCHAGKAVQTLASASRNIEDKSAINRLMSATGSAILAATSSEQEAKEGIIKNGEGHGVFTHVLLEGLRGKADAASKDGQVDVEELIQYTRREVPKISKELWEYEQFPMYHPPKQNFPIALIR